MKTLRIAVWLAMAFLPGFASAQSAEDKGSTPESASIQGIVKDTSGSTVAGAIVTLEPAASTDQRTAITDQTGAFRFSPVEPGNYKITIAASGFAVWTVPNVAITSSDNQPQLSPVLQVAATTSSVDVTLPPHELATQQLKTEEKQRLLGVLPDFLVSYAPNPVPLTIRQKFHLGWKLIIDPVSLA